MPRPEFSQPVENTEGQTLDIAAPDSLSVSTDESASSVTISNAEDISGGVTANLSTKERALFLSVSGAVEVAVEVSPDGATYYVVSESPVVFDGQGSEVVELDYTGESIRLTSSDSTVNVTAQLCER